MQHIHLTDNINRLKLTTNQLNILKKIGIKTVDDLIKSTKSGSLKKLSKASINDIEHIISGLYSGKDGCIIGDDDPIISCVLDVLSQEQAIDLHYNLLLILEKHESMTIEEIMKAFPHKRDAAQKLLSAMAEYSEVRIENNTYIPAPSIVDYVENIQDKRKRDIALSRLHDERTQDIGKHFGITHQRVHQIYAETFRLARKEIQYFREDKYINFLCKYSILVKDFMLAFDEPISTYNYFKGIFTDVDSVEDFKSALQDEMLPITMRKQLEEAIYHKKYVTIDSQRIVKSRKALAMYYTKTYCRDITTYDDFKHGYRAFLDDLGLYDRAVMKDSLLESYSFLLWGFKRQLRYYNIQSRDYKKLLDEIDLMQYDGYKISTLDLFKKHLKLMAEYDIRNGYELHNLLRKINSNDRIIFKRMPIIIVGEE